MIKTITIHTKTLEETGSKAGWFDGSNKANYKTIVDSEKLANDIDKEAKGLLEDGFQILSVIPVTSQKFVSYNYKAILTTSVIVTAIKMN